MESGLSHCYAKWLEQFQKLLKKSLINGEGVGKGKTKKVFAKYCLYIFTKMQVLYRSKESGMMYGKRNVIHKSTLSLQCNPVDFNQSASIRQKDFWSHSIVTQHVLVFMLISKNIFTRWCSSAAWSKPSLLCKWYTVFTFLKPGLLVLLYVCALAAFIVWGVSTVSVQWVLLIGNERIRIMLSYLKMKVLALQSIYICLRQSLLFAVMIK